MTLTAYFEIHEVENGRYGWSLDDMGGMGMWMGSWRYMNGVTDMGWDRFGGYGCGCVVLGSAYFMEIGGRYNSGGDRGEGRLINGW